MSKVLKTKLLVEVSIGDIENKYPNYQFNYGSKREFLEDNIVSGLEHIADEEEYDAGYETVVANGMLDVMETYVEVGDKVGFIHRSGYMNKNAKLKVGRVVSVETIADEVTKEEYRECKIQYTTDNGRKSTISRKEVDILDIYSLIDELGCEQ